MSLTTNELQLLEKIQALDAFSAEELLLFTRYLIFLELPTESLLIHEGDCTREMFFILSGTVRLCRAKLDLGLLSAGQHFGELGLIVGRPRSATAIARTPVQVAKLTEENYQKMTQQQPALALMLMQSLIRQLGLQLTEMSDSVDLLLRQRSLPRRTQIQINIDGNTQSIRTGTTVDSVLPDQIGTATVVAGLLNHKAVSLETQLFADAQLSPLTNQHWEGERIYRHSMGLLLLEAASEILPDHRFNLGLSLGVTQWIDLPPELMAERENIAQQLTQRMQEMIQHDVPFRWEQWTRDEAFHYFTEHQREAEAKLLLTLRSATVSLATCGHCYVLAMGPLIPRAGLLQAFTLRPSETGLALTMSDAQPALEPLHAYVSLTQEHQSWLKSLHLDSVGQFNHTCITGEVSQIIRVSEGFHEKRLGQIADTISQHHPRIRVICIAGPSSSGKTTFIKRLTIQLQVNGLRPIGISLDDYYVDRDQTPRDEQGEFDFERLDALNLPLLGEHLERLLRGETVATAHYNFEKGQSEPDGGPVITLGEQDVLMLEGIHGLNPKLLNGTVPEGDLFRIFIQPTASLPFDILSRVNPSDLRLLRRIVRDRRGRGCSAADNIMRWPSVRQGEQKYIFPFVEQADAIFDTSLIYEISVLKVFAERYLLEVPQSHPAYTTAFRLRQFIDNFVTIYPDHVPPTSILREFIGGSGFEY